MEHFPFSSSCQGSPRDCESRTGLCRLGRLLDNNGMELGNHVFLVVMHFYDEHVNALAWVNECTSTVILPWVFPQISWKINTHPDTRQGLVRNSELICCRSLDQYLYLLKMHFLIVYCERLNINPGWAAPLSFYISIPNHPYLVCLISYRSQVEQEKKKKKKKEKKKDSQSNLVRILAGVLLILV